MIQGFGKSTEKNSLNLLTEIWECSTHSDGQSLVANGRFSGSTLAEVLKEHPEYLGSKCVGCNMPILVKFIDTKQNLSVRVHPDDEYAKKHESDNDKTEMRYVVDVAESASLICGFEHPVTESILREAVDKGTLGKY